MSAEQLSKLAACIKALIREQASLERLGAASRDMKATAKRRANANESARLCAVEIRRLKLQAHCLAVEIGIADMRPESHYTGGLVPMGFGRVMRLEEGVPRATCKDGLHVGDATGVAT